MAREKFAQIVQKKDEDIKNEILECAKVLLRFRFQAAEGGIKAHEVKATRRRIARLKTALGVKANKNQGGGI